MIDTCVIGWLTFSLHWLSVLHTQSPTGAQVGALAAFGGERPNLAIVDDTLPQRAAITLREIRVRNLGGVTGKGFVSVAIVDSVGMTQTELVLEGGRAIRVPAASLGGSEGRVVLISGPPPFEKLLDSLIRAQSRFGLRARVRTVGGDADESDNVRTREWGPWVRMAPDSTTTLSFVFTVSEETPTVQISTESIGTPFGAILRQGRYGDTLFFHPGRHTWDIRLFTPQELPHGSLFVERVTLTDSATGEILQQHERFAAYDTVPPMLSSYRAILLRDGRVAIQVRAADLHSGTPPSGVVTRYSQNGGETWQEEVHSFAEDDFGQPALFETVVGPFSAGVDLLIGISAHDRAGNTNATMPIDASVLLAPRNAERALSIALGSLIDGNPIFVPEIVARLRTIIDSARTNVMADGFERRRLQELRGVPDAFRRWDVTLSDFEEVKPRLVRLVPQSGVECTVLELFAWRE